MASLKIRSKPGKQCFCLLQHRAILLFKALLSLLLSLVGLSASVVLCALARLLLLETLRVRLLLGGRKKWWWWR